MKQTSLFDSFDENLSQPNQQKLDEIEERSTLLRPLADRMRPSCLEEYFGQQHLIAPGSLLWNMIEKDIVPSMIFWGPPGVGKTTLASIIAAQTKSHFINFSAVQSGIKEIKSVMSEAEMMRKSGSGRLCLSMKFIASIKCNKMLFYLMSKKEASSLLAQLRKILALR